MRSTFGILLPLILPFTALAEHRHHHSYGTDLTLSVAGGALFGDTLEEGESPLFDEGVDVDDAFIAEGRCGIRIKPWFELEGTLSFTPSEFVVSGSSGLFGDRGDVSVTDVDIWHYSLNANFHFARSDEFDPFFTIGAGAATYDVEVAGIDSDTKFLAVIGGGFTFWFTEAAGLRMDAKDLITVLDVDNDYDYDCDCYRDYDSESDTLHNVAVTVGLALRFRLDK